METSAAEQQQLRAALDAALATTGFVPVTGRGPFGASAGLHAAGYLVYRQSLGKKLKEVNRNVVRSSIRYVWRGERLTGNISNNSGQHMSSLIKLGNWRLLRLTLGLEQNGSTLWQDTDGSGGQNSVQKPPVVNRWSACPGTTLTGAPSMLSRLTELAVFTPCSNRVA
jgi:hypothetical protein